MLNNNLCYKKQQILLVEPEERFIIHLKDTLGDLFSLLVVNSYQSAVEIIKQRQDDIAIAFIDYSVYKLGNNDLFSLLSEFSPFCVKVLTSDVNDTDLLVEGINNLDIYYYIVKPFQQDDVLHVVYNALFYRERIIKRKEIVTNLKELLFSTIQAICEALEAKDIYTIGHSRRVTLYSLLIGKELGLSKQELQKLHLAGLLHDIGKIAVPESILNKPGKLTDEEYMVIQNHPGTGAEILRNLRQLEGMVHWVESHHERYDGRGYPRNLSGEEIPLGAAILAVADTYDAMTSDRSYRKGLAHEVALEEIKRCTGSQFNPEVTKAFLFVEKEIESFKNDKSIDTKQNVLELLEEDTDLVIEKISIAS